MNCLPNLEYALLYINRSKDIIPDREPGKISFDEAHDRLLGMVGTDWVTTIEVEFFQRDLLNDNLKLYGEMQRNYRQLMDFCEKPVSTLLSQPILSPLMVFRQLRRHVHDCYDCTVSYEQFLVEQTRAKAVTDGVFDSRLFAQLYRSEDNAFLNVLSDTSFHF